MNKLLNLLLLITFQFGYLQWGATQQAFIFQVTADVFSRTKSSQGNFLHPAILFPLIGEILIFITLFSKTTSRVLTFAGITCMGLLMLLLLVVGLLSANIKILLSTVPFFVMAFLIIRFNWKNKAKAIDN